MGISVYNGGVEAFAFHRFNQKASVDSVKGLAEINEEQVALLALFNRYFEPDLISQFALCILY